MPKPVAKDATNSPPRILLGRIGPAVLLICLLLDITLRFLPPRLVSFRAWEPVTFLAPSTSPFNPNMAYSNKQSYGDLAGYANLPHLREYREEVFHTDAAGYRNRGAVVKPFQGILLTGDSFTAGSGISDEQTLSEQLQRISGIPVYNAALTPNLGGLLHDLQMTRGLVIWQVSERNPLPSSHFPPEPSWRTRLRRALGNERAETVFRMTNSLVIIRAYSPLQILFGRAVRLLQNDQILPNPYHGAAVSAKLRNGRETLFISTEVQNYALHRPADPEFLVQLNTQLQKQGLGLLVLLVPDKYFVYHDLLLKVPPHTEHRPFLDVVEQRLAAANVPVINLSTRFRKQAEALLDHDQYLYWMDDTHWNAAGIREAAQALADSKAVSECRCR